MAVNSLVLLANAPIATLLGLWDQAQQASVLLQRLQDVLEAEPEQVQDADSRYATCAGCRVASRCARSR